MLFSLLARLEVYSGIAMQSLSDDERQPASGFRSRSVASSVEQHKLIIQQAFIAAVFIILAIFTYAYFFKMPYAGFDFSGGYIVEVWSGSPGNGLQVGDRLIQVGEVLWEEFTANVVQPLLANVQAGEVVELTVAREGEVLTIPWTIPGFSREVFLERLFNNWWLAYIFWTAAAVTYLFIRPADKRWHLFIAFFLLTAVWLSAGSNSRWHIWYSALVLKATVWLCIPVYWHLHWHFPKPLGRLPRWLVWAVYGAGIILALLELLQLLPQSLHLFGFLLAIAGVLALLLAHAILQVEQRESLHFLLRVGVVVILLMIVGGVLSLSGNLRPVSLALTGLPLLPLAYIYVIYRHHSGKLELRANRIIVLYLYFIIIATSALILGTIVTNLFGQSRTTILLILITAIVVGLITAVSFPAFERFVERRILGMSLPLGSLLETYATQIVTKLDKAALIQLLKEQVLPSLLVRQSAIIYWEESRPSPVTLFTMGIENEDLPTAADIPTLLKQAGAYRSLHSDDGEAQVCPWVQLSLRLRVGDKRTGLWLLGRRDPDDIYLQQEIPTLQALAAQTAIALTNILQAENLHMLYQANIDRHESERTRLALELHDIILSRMALLVIYIDEDQVTPQFYETFEELTTRFRQTISNLRPAMLNYGLRTALDDLVDRLQDRIGDNMLLKFNVSPSHIRYPVNVEQHVFRIVQQAVENALQHAEARQLLISGSLALDSIQLVVEDDGVGFLSGEYLDLSALLMNKHFGLAGMFERAALIGAQVKIDSAPGRGTRVSTTWKVGATGYLATGFSE